MKDITLINGDNVAFLCGIPSNTVDSVVTDCPYGLKFMGKKWDYDVPSVYQWEEVFRVLKPGGYLLSFGGTRTYHRLVVNIEDAGFQIRDQIQWLYGQGFPKSVNISKGIDKKFGADREVVSKTVRSGNIKGGQMHAGRKNVGIKVVCKETKPSTDLAKQWDGYGTALKPANEPIVLAQKPISEKTIVDNVLRWGVGGLNIDGCRIEFNGDENLNARQTTTKLSNKKFFDKETRIFEGQQTYDQQGRFPANILLDDQAADMLDYQTGILKSGGYPPEFTKKQSKNCYGNYGPRGAPKFKTNEGGASRFFYCAKTSKKERGDGNIHPTVKPIRLMEYLIKLACPPGGIVLDPYMGSGSTGIAAKNLGFKFIGIELDDKYFKIAKKRIEEA